MLSNRVVITGLGVLSVAGENISAFKQNIFSGTPLFRKPERHSPDFEVVVGELLPEFVPEKTSDLYDSMTGRLALAAARECVYDAVSRGSKKPDGMILGTSAGGQANNESFVFSLLSNKKLPEFDFHRHGVVASPTRMVAEELDICGPVMTLSTACTSSANAIAMGAEWIRRGRCSIVLVGGADDLCATTVCGFHSLLLTGAEPCRPFGEDRPGMTLGEGAAFLMLESMEEVNKQDRNYYGELLGYGLSVDAYHLTAPSEGGVGAQKAMKKALSRADLKVSDVHWINAHGTGTEMNDRSESQAINSLFGTRVPVSSLKGLLGHTLGGAGAIEAVVSLLALKSKRAPENYFSDKAAKDCPVSLVPKGGAELHGNAVVLSNSFGFGGSNCTLIFGEASSDRKIAQ